MARPFAPVLLERFKGREALDRDTATQQYWSEYPSEPLTELFDLFEQEYTLPAGILRPDDRIDVLTHPLPGRHPALWLFREAGLEDAASRLSSQLSRRAHLDDLSGIQTVGALAAAWCGMRPN